MWIKHSVNGLQRIPRLYGLSAGCVPSVVWSRRPKHWWTQRSVDCNYDTINRPHIHSKLMKQFSSDHQMSDKCWKCLATLDTSQVRLFCHKCHSIQALHWDLNYYHLFQQNFSFDVNLFDLNKEFKKLQMATHPDKWVNASHREHTYSMDNSSLINKAYKTLRDPYERGVYLLNILFNTQIQENETRFDSQFLSEIMKVNEDIEENIVSKNKLMNIFTDNEKNMKKVMHDMSLAFESNDVINAKLLLSKFKFYITLDLSLKEKLAKF